MSMFRKKPVVVEAVKWDGDALIADTPEWFVSALERGAHVGGFVVNTRGELMIFTLEGNMIASGGDWIIKGVAGEFYPCKPDIFAATYEAIPTDGTE